MTWAEVLAVFNFIAWLLPIIIRSWMAWKYGDINRVTLSIEEHGQVSRAIAKLKLGNKKLKLDNRTETDRDIQEGSK